MKLIKKYGVMGALVIALVTELLTGFAHEWIKSIFNKNSPAAIVNQDFSVKGDDDNCSLVLPFNGSSEWTLIGYKTKNDSYCTYSNEESYPLMWLKSLIPTAITSFTISFPIPDEINMLPPFVLGVGKESKLLHLYFFEKNPRIIGVSKSRLSETNNVIFGREPPIELPETPLPGSSASITLRGVLKGNNIVTYFFNYEYVPQLRPGTKEEFSQSTEVYVPDPSLMKGNSLTEIGVGTLSGNCIQPSTYQICQ